MPVYEYACQKCGHTYEKREGFDAPARQRCPKCRGAAQRVLYAPPIVFKGSGFYITDSRKSESGTVGDSSSSSDKTESTSKPGKSGKKDSGSASSTEAAAAS